MHTPYRLAATITALLLHGAAALAAPTPLASAPVQRAPNAGGASFDAVVEASRQSVISAQVAGTVLTVAIEVGDQVRPGQSLLRLDARAATETSLASDAQVQASRAAQGVAVADFARQRTLFEQHYISAAAFERADAQFRATSAALAAQSALARAARIESGLYVVSAPYAGVVSERAVAQGDMAQPGRPLLTLYDPQTLRVTLALPQSVLAQIAPGQGLRVELPDLPAGQRSMLRTQWQLLPTIDAASHTAQLRIDLPAGLKGVMPGMFARVWLPIQSAGALHLQVPAAAIVRRAEMTGLYVIGPSGQPLLRQVRLGRASADSVEVLAGVSEGERVALDPQAAAKVRP
jgi:multidrug efflux system membrane fusion protein